MFTFLCPTCEATLIAKDEKLLGKILACPKCGSMVQVQSTDDAPTPLVDPPPKPILHKRFPDVLTNETASAVIGPTPKENIRSDLLLVDSPESTDLSETELKTRVVLVGILIGLLAILVIALGFLMMFRKSTVPTEPAQKLEQVIPVPDEPPPPEIIPQQPEPAPVIPAEPPAEEESVPKKEPAESPKIEPEVTPTEPESPVGKESPSEDDFLDAFERKMPGLLETSVPNIDIDAKLALPILELKIEQQNLVGFLQVLSSLTGIPLTLNIDEIRSHSLSTKTPVNGFFAESTIEAVMTETLATLGLQWKTADRQITIMPTDIDDEEDLIFDVSDFAEHTDDLTHDVLAAMIQKLVCPEEKISVLPNRQLSVVQDNDSIVPKVKSRKRLRSEILRFLEQLRAIRQLPQQTEWSGATLAPEAFGWDRVMEPMTLHYYRSVSLAKVVEQLESKTGLTILIDHQSLHQSLCSYAAVQTTVQCNGGTVNDALELSLASADSAALEYRIIDDQTLEITTAESVGQPAKMTVEVHRYQLEENELPEEIVRELRSAVEPESWFVEGQPEKRFGGNIVIDRSSGCLLVRQNQPVQRQIRLYLSEPAQTVPQ